jgi:hypothetical protein
MEVLKGIAGPLFDFGRREDGAIVGEDQFFFGKLREAGVPVYLDHGLSWQIGHIGERIHTLANVARARVQTFTIRPGAPIKIGN